MIKYPFFFEDENEHAAVYSQQINALRTKFCFLLLCIQWMPNFTNSIAAHGVLL